MVKDHLPPHEQQQKVGVLVKYRQQQYHADADEELSSLVATRKRNVLNVRAVGPPVEPV